MKKYLICLFSLCFIMIGITYYSSSNKKNKDLKEDKELKFNTYCKLKNSNNDTVVLNDLNNKLIFIFTPYSCQNCIEFNISQINRIRVEYGNKINIALLCLFDSDRDLTIFKKNNNIQLPTYRCLNNLFEGNHYYTSFDPFFITFDKNRNSFFIIHQCSKEANNTYNFVYNYFINDNSSLEKN